MKENLVNDKEQAFLSKTLATIDTKAPIEIGLDDLVYSGPNVETLGNSTMSWALNSSNKP